MARGDGYDQALSLWSIQESLLQAYRSIFITAESVIFAIAAAIANSTPYSAIILTFLGYFLLWMWHKVCANRALDVSFTQWLLIQAEEGIDIPTPVGCLKRFQAGEIITINDRPIQRHIKKPSASEINDKLFVSMTKGPTRRWMETYLPLLFAVLWLVVAYLAALAIHV